MTTSDPLSDPKIIEQLMNGAVGVIPTDTIYGLVARAADQTAVKRLYELKKRENKPGTIIAANIEQVVELGVQRRYLKAVEQFWPNPISIEIPHQVTYLNQGTGRQAFRIVKDQKLSELLQKTGPLVTSSANNPGEKPSDTIEEAKKYFGQDVDFYVDGGDLSNRPPSTIIRIVDDAIEIVRQGAVKLNEAGRIDEF